MLLLWYLTEGSSFDTASGGTHNIRLSFIWSSHPLAISQDELFMIATSIKTRPLLPPQDNLLEVINESITKLDEGDVVAVSSKVVAIWQGRCVPIPKNYEDHKKLKDKLIRGEADYYVEKDEHFQYSRIFTIYEGIFGSSAGIDESNGDGYFIFLPKDSPEVARTINAFLRKKFGLKNIGVVIVDSRTTVMRNGVVGIALGHAGFNALYDYRGRKDIFGRELHFERLHVADCIATTATLIMGEGDECAPLAVLSDIPHIDFNEREDDDSMLLPCVPREDDVFAQFLHSAKWQKGNQEIDSHEKD